MCLTWVKKKEKRVSIHGFLGKWVRSKHWAFPQVLDNAVLRDMELFGTPESLRLHRQSVARNFPGRSNYTFAPLPFFLDPWISLWSPFSIPTVFTLLLLLKLLLGSSQNLNPLLSRLSPIPIKVPSHLMQILTRRQCDWKKFILRC